MRSRIGTWRRSLLLSLPLLLAGCINERAPPNPFPVASETDAAALVRGFFHSAALGDFEAAVDVLCDLSAQERSAARSLIARAQTPSSLFRIDHVDIRSVKSHWVGTEPTFWVEVALPRRDGTGEILSAYRVRVRTGCIENFVGAMPDARPATRGDEGPRGDDAARPAFNPIPSQIPTLPPPASQTPLKAPLRPDSFRVVPDACP